MRPHSRISFSVNNLMGTYTLHCRDASLWSYFILDSVISLGTYTHLVCLVQHHCCFHSESFLFSFFVSTLILDSWAPPPTILSTHHFQGHLHPMLWGHTHNHHPFLLHSWLIPTPTNPGLEPPNHHHSAQQLPPFPPLQPQPPN